MSVLPSSPRTGADGWSPIVLQILNAVATRDAVSSTRVEGRLKNRAVGAAPRRRSAALFARIPCKPMLAEPAEAASSDDDEDDWAPDSV